MLNINIGSNIFLLFPSSTIHSVFYKVICWNNFQHNAGIYYSSIMLVFCQQINQGKLVNILISQKVIESRLIYLNRTVSTLLYKLVVVIINPLEQSCFAIRYHFESFWIVLTMILRIILRIMQGVDSLIPDLIPAIPY